MKRYLMGAVIVVFAVVIIHVPYSWASLNLFSKFSVENELDAGDEPVPVSSHPAGSCSSTNVSLDNDLYRDMESWAAEGLIDSQILSIKPLTKNEAGRQIAAALDKCAAMEKPSATCRNIREYYAKLFAPEIAEARDGAKVRNTFLKPVDSASVSYEYLDGPFSIYNQEGIPYGNGHNAVVQFEAEARLWKVLSFSVEPQLAYFDDPGNRDEGSDSGMWLHRGYAKLTVFNLELEVGRDSLWWGPGYHGSLLMSNNAHPFDMIKLSNPEPVVLPWIFSYLGPVQFNLIFSQLNDVRKGAELANPFLYGLRLAIKPHPYLELGASHLVLFGGPERRDLSFGDLIKTLYSNQNHDNEKTDSNQEFAVDFALTIPHIKNMFILRMPLSCIARWAPKIRERHRIGEPIWAASLFIILFLWNVLFCVASMGICRPTAYPMPGTIIVIIRCVMKEMCLVIMPELIRRIFLWNGHRILKSYSTN